MNTDISWLEGRLNGPAAPLVIDGGMGTELEKSGVPMDGRVWSGRAVMSHPESVRRAHEAFINAGAEVIITNTFAAARHMLEPGPIGVCPESGYFEMPNRQFVDVVAPDDLVRQARGWVHSGVLMVGGCCGLGPERIRALRQAFTDKPATTSKSLK